MTKPKKDMSALLATLAAPAPRSGRTDPTKPSEAMEKRPASRKGAKSLQVFMDEPDHRVIKVCAAELGMSIDEFVKTALNYMLEANGKAAIATKKT